MKALSFAILPLLFLSGSAFAEDAARFTLEKTADGYVRMDKTTGEMSICTQQSDQLVCRIAADDRVAMEDDIARLDARLTKVEEKLATSSGSGALSNSTLPTDEEFEKSMTLMEKFFRRFMGVVKDLNEDGTPQKT
jgi:hypothetical protein